jgi:hypothetical protein
MESGKSVEKPVAFISGATSGIGKATALLLAKNGYRLIVAGRRPVPLNKLASDIENLYKTSCLSLVFDVRDLDHLQRIFEILPEEWKDIDILVNNAGLAAGLDPVHQGSIADWNQMIDTNIKGTLFLTRLIAPGMIERRRGHIINISSIAGKEVYPSGAVYAATKHAVEALTKGMRQDFVNYGVKVSSVSPGAVETEFSLVRFKGDEARAKKVYEGFTPLSAEDIAESILFILSRPPHVNIQDILIMPAAQASATMINRNEKSRE